MNNFTSAPDNLLNSQSKDNSRATQLQTISLFFNENVATASEAAEATGIKQKNICRYKSDLQKKGQLVELYKAPCKITGFKAYYLTTNPELFPVNPQTKLF